MNIAQYILNGSACPVHQEEGNQRAAVIRELPGAERNHYQEPLLYITVRHASESDQERSLLREVKHQGRLPQAQNQERR